MKRLIFVAVLLLPSLAFADSWRDVMTPLDPRPPLPKPSEPDADTDNDGPFHAPAPKPPAAKKATVKPKAKAVRPKVQTASVKSEPEPAACGCKCETCGCPEPATYRKGNPPEVELEPRLEPIESPAPKQVKAAAPKAIDYSTDIRLTRDASGTYFGIAPNGVTYYATNPKDVVWALNNPPPAPTASFMASQPSLRPYTLSSFGADTCTTGTCGR